MRKIISVIFLFIISISCQKDEPVATNGTIQGRVTDKISNEPINGAAVTVKGNQITTGSDGTFTVSEIYSDTYQVSVAKPGYVSDAKSVVVSPEKVSRADFSLSRLLPVISPDNLTFEKENLSLSLTFENRQSDRLTYTIQTSQSWISVSPQSATIESGNSKIISVEIDPQTLDYGVYNESIVVNVASSSVSVPILFNYEREPYIEITNPTENGEYKMGEIMPIQWESNLNGNVKIELLRFSSVNQVITSSTANSNGGNFSWSIPPLEEAAYQLKISSVESENISNTSQAFNIIEGPTVPDVITKNPSEITPNSITISGEILSFGVQATSVSQYGHVYSKNNPNPTISDNRTRLGESSVLGNFTSVIEDLDSGDTYYIAAYAVNEKGVAYGGVISVTTPADLPVVETSNATLITKNSATTGGIVTSDGGNSIVERGICYGKNSPVTVDSNVIVDGDQTTGAFTSELTGLSAGTIYYARAFAKNSAGIGYGEQIQFITLADTPNVSTVSGNSISASSIDLVGKINNDGGDELISYGFVYSLNENPTIGDNKVNVTDNDSGLYRSTVANLSADTTYYFRAFGTNSVGTSYGEQIAVKTQDGLPVVSTLDLTIVESTKIKAIGSVDSDGGSELISYGFVYSSENPEPTINDSKIEKGDSTFGEYFQIIQNLLPETGYYVRAYATNSVSTSYGDVLNITTEAGTYFSFNSPLASDSYSAGQTMVIDWTTNLTGDVIVELFLDGSFHKEINSNIPISDGGLSWVIPSNQEISSSYQIVVKDFDSLETIASSDEFSITGVVNIISPVENAEYFIEEGLVVSWDINYETNFKIELYQGSQLVEVLDESTPSSSGSITYNSLNANHAISGDNNYRIKITDLNSSSTYLTANFSLFDVNSGLRFSGDNDIVKIVKIGNQLWTAEDVRSKINIVNRNYSNFSSGYVYEALKSREVFDSGWKLPNNEDFKSLEVFLGMNQSETNSDGERLTGNVGKKLKNSDCSGTDDYGFNMNCGSIHYFEDIDSYKSYSRGIRTFTSDSDGVIKTTRGSYSTSNFYESGIVRLVKIL